ncbi:hypothetical protein PSEG_02513 [Pseudomonas sp. Nvir]|jgi:hypothetical protein|nr:hypothetical protein PSNVIR_04279 [Pseudomonas sp. Nvir]
MVFITRAACKGCDADGNRFYLAAKAFEENDPELAKALKDAYYVAIQAYRRYAHRAHRAAAPARTAGSPTYEYAATKPPWPPTPTACPIPRRAPRNLPCRCSDTIGIIGKVGSQQYRIPEIVGIPDSPKRGFQGIDHISRRANVFARFVRVLPRIDDRGSRLQRPHPGCQRLDLVCAVERQVQLASEQLAAILNFDGAMGHAALGDALPPACRERMTPVNSRRREAYQRTIACGRGLDIAHPAKPLGLPPFQGSAGDIADVEAAVIDAVFAVPLPTHQCISEGCEIELALAGVGVRQAQGHTGIVGSLTRRQAERTTADHIADMPLITPLELQGRAYRITCTLLATTCPGR